jgi:hypothetical protein
MEVTVGGMDAAVEPIGIILLKPKAACHWNASG